MPKRKDIESILIIGAGPIVIGQACEFDYSGTQACNVLKEEGYRVVLINSNPATIMTDPKLSDATYIEPITLEVVENIIIKEKIDAVLPTVGGQVALNCAMQLFHSGVLKKHNVELIGASPDSIEKAENRLLFNLAMQKIGLSCPKNMVINSIDEAAKALEYVGLPAIIRPSFTLGGTGGGVAYNKEEFEAIILGALEASPTSEVQVDESIIGWKEYEMEVVRDKKDNCIIVCSIENVDPMGVHTGDSITVAPALTLTDKEYQTMRNASLAVIREIGVDTGGSNVQFAVNPQDGRLLVIEMNPRVSRSSALASKATGFPIAKVAARLAVGYTLDEILNDCTKATPASFEPVIDYVVTKIPRFNFEKFMGTKVSLTTSMKSIGEVMAIGRSFAESFQKALRSMETGISGLDEVDIGNDKESIQSSLSVAVPDRILRIAQSFRQGFSVEEVRKITYYDPWFLNQIKKIVDVEQDLKLKGLPDNSIEFLALKKLGFSDQRLSKIVGIDAQKVFNIRKKLEVFPVFKRIDTCASEFASNTKYMYSCYEGDSINIPECESEISDKDKIMVIGSGPNRIGQGIEFDCCCVHAITALKEEGYETIMVNCNPETVSTDYDLADRLYFEPLTEESISYIALKEMEKGCLKGVIVQYGGQTPIKLAKVLKKYNIPILGTSPEAIDIAEDRELFKNLIDDMNLKQPANSTATSIEDLKEKVKKIGYPLVIRPSFVLGGSKMEIIYNDSGLERYIAKTFIDFKEGPVLIDSFLQNAKEVDVDAICDQKEVVIAGIMEHIEEAGIHSGDSACSLPAYSLSSKVLDLIKSYTKILALKLEVKGLMNVQFAIKDDDVYIIEVNPRASRTIPFVSKVTNVEVAGIASKVMAGKPLSDFNLKDDLYSDLNYIAVKEAVFPFAKFPGADIILGPEMKSTGEVMGIDFTFSEAFAKAQIAAGNDIPKEGTVFISVKSKDKNKDLYLLADGYIKLGFYVVATAGTAGYLKEKGLEINIVNKVLEGRPHIVDLMKDGKINLVINTTEGSKSISDSFSIRETALLNKISYSTTIEGAKAVLSSIMKLKEKGVFNVYSMQSYF